MAQHTTSTLPRLAVLVLLIVGAIYANAHLGGFVYDDWDLVVRNPWLRDGHVLEAFRSGYWESSRGGSFYYRPIVSISYWVDHALWGTNPFGYHLRNVALHAASSVLVLLLAARWLSSRPAALAAAALFAVHPIHTQSVTWIAGRTDLLAAFFCLAALLFFQVGAERLSRLAGGFLIAAGLAAFALALLSKEMAVTFPALLLLHAILVSRGARLHAGGSAGAGKGAKEPRGGSALGLEATGSALVGSERDLHAGSSWSVWRIWAVPLAGSIVLVLGWLWLRAAVVGTAVGYADDPHAWWHPDDGTRSRLLAVPLIVAFYLRRLIFPLGLGFESGIQPVRDAADPVVWSAAAGTALLLFLAWRLRGRRPAASFGIVWLLVSLLPVLNILPVFESAMEHFAYLPSVGFIVAAVAIGRGILRRTDARVALCVGLVVLLGVRTTARNGDWKDEETFWRITVRDTPSARAWNNLGLHLRDRGDLEGASEAFENVRRLRPDLASSWSNLGAVEAARGRRPDALRLLHEALAVEPTHRDSLYNLALVLETDALGERYGAGSSLDEAEEAYRRLLAAHPDHAEGWTNLGVLLERLARPGEAAQAFEEAIRAAPSLAEPHLFLADLLWERGERPRASDLYRRYLEIGGAGDDAARALSRAGR